MRGALVLGLVAACGRLGFEVPGDAVPGGGGDGLGSNAGDGAVHAPGRVTKYPIGGAAEAVAIADFDGDGHLDIATVSGQVVILLGKGDGTFTVGGAYAAGMTPDKIAAGDLDGDGHVDLAVSNNNGTGTGGATVILGDGTGAFGAAKQISNVSEPDGIAIADVNRDGHLDVIVVAGSTGELLVLRGNGTGNFAAQSPVAIGPSPANVLIRDLDGDGWPDAMVSGWGGGELDVLAGSSSGFAAPQIYTGSGLDHAQGIALADLDGDGREDLVISSAASVNDYVTVMLGGAGTAFGTPMTFSVPRSAVVMATGDFDGDGKIDAVTSAYPTGEITALFGDGTGALGGKLELSVDPDPIYAAAADLDGDGISDLVIAQSGSAELTVILGPLR